MTKRDLNTGNNPVGEKHYYYLHTNGDLIHKTAISVDSMGAEDYFDSDFVVTWWILYTGNRLDAWNLCIAASLKGARPDRVQELVEKWGLTDEDARTYCSRVGLILETGIRHKWLVVPRDTGGKSVIQTGFGDTGFEAIVRFYRNAINEPQIPEQEEEVFSPGDRVIYTPPHAKGDISHPDSEEGIVSSVRENGSIFVRYRLPGGEFSDTGKLTPKHLLRKKIF